VSADAEIPASAAYRVKLPDFEGPLDLLLHLCKTHEIDIVSLPVSFITQKYLEYLEVMQSMSVEVAAEYLVMAATLAYLKSRELVPTPEPLETVGEDGEEALHQLLARIRDRLAVGVDLTWQQHARLQVDEQRRLVDVFAGDVEVELLHQRQVLVELVADARHRDVGDLHLVDLDQVQQEVERPLEDRQADPPRLGQRGGVQAGVGHDGRASLVRGDGSAAGAAQALIPSPLSPPPH